MASKSHYHVLQVSREATVQEITAAYRALARRYHPDRNPAADAKARMQAINEAYAVLRDPARRQRYDATLEPAATYRSPRQPRPEPAAQTQSHSWQEAEQRAPRSPRAWLRYQLQVGDTIIIAIERADDIGGLLAELQRRIPAAARRYYIDSNCWHISVAYADVLGDLFYNFALRTEERQTAGAAGPSQRPDARRTSRTVPPRSRRRPAPQPWASTAGSQRGPWFGLGLALTSALIVYALLLGRVLAPATESALAAPAEAVVAAAVEAPAPPLDEAAGGAPAAEGFNATGFNFPDDCAALAHDQAPAYLQAACSAILDEPLTTTRFASNLRDGPGTEFPVLATVPPGSLLRLTGYNSDGRHVWYQTSFGGWIRGDLVTQVAVDLPYVPLQMH